MAEIVKKWDANNDGRTSIREFADGIGAPDADVIEMEMGKDYEWWNCGNTIAWAVMSANNRNGYYDVLEPYQFEDILSDFGLDPDDAYDFVA